MKIIWFTWKDINHPKAGGAEVVAKELAKRLAADGHEVVFVTSRYLNANAEDTINGYKVIRLGNRFSVYWAAFRYYRKYLRNWADLVIDEVNTIPFFAKFYVRKPHVLFVHMLCRKIWFYELPLPFSFFGFLIEPLYLRSLSNQKVITVSQSTKQDLVRYGFDAKNIHIISEGIELKPIDRLEKIKKFNQPTILSLGALRPMKRTLDQLKAFEIAKSTLPQLKLKIAGDSSGKYGRKILSAIAKSPYQSDIEVLGRVNQSTKLNLLRRCHLILVTSVKEGWGLIVTEANSQGTPAIVYDVDGLRDSVKPNKTGLISTEINSYALAEKTTKLINNKSQYKNLRIEAWRWSKEINFDSGYRQFKAVLGI